MQGGLVKVVSDCILGGTPVAVCVLHNGGGDTLLVLLLVLILIYGSDITISNESGVAWWWSAVRTLFATFCPVIAGGYYLYQRAKCFQHSQRRNCSSESGIDWACICRAAAWLRSP